MSAQTLIEKITETLMKPGGESQQYADGNASWPEPQPLPVALPAVQEFSPSLLPEAFRQWLSDISDRMQCPPDFPAVGAMVAVASLIGRQVAIRPKRRDDWIEVCNLWGAIIGRPGIMKSPALAESMKPLRRLVAEAQASHREAGKDWSLELEALKAQQDALKAELKKSYKSKVVELGAVKGTRGESDRILENIHRLKEREEGDAPHERRYMTSDTTTEKLGELLAENPSGLLVFRDELTGWLRSLDRESREADRAFYLESWNGTGAFTFDRIGRGTIRLAATVPADGLSKRPRRLGKRRSLSRYCRQECRVSGIRATR